MGYLNCNVLTEQKIPILEEQLRGLDLVALGETGEGTPELHGFVRYGSDSAMPPVVVQGGVGDGDSIGL